MPPVRPIQTQPPSMAERIAAFRAEIDAVIDQMAEKEKLQSPGLPLAVIRNSITARGGSCQCRQYLIATGELK
jgi:hypothetical protein